MFLPGSFCLRYGGPKIIKTIERKRVWGLGGFFLFLPPFRRLNGRALALGEVDEIFLTR